MQCSQHLYQVRGSKDDPQGGKRGAGASVQQEPIRIGLVCWQKGTQLSSDDPFTLFVAQVAAVTLVGSTTTVSCLTSTTPVTLARWVPLSWLRRIAVLGGDARNDGGACITC